MLSMLSISTLIFFSFSFSVFRWLSGFSCHACMCAYDPPVCVLVCRGVNLGGWGGRDPQILDKLCRGGSQGGRSGVVDWSSNIIIISYHVQEVCSKVVTFEEKYNILPKSCCK